MYERNGGSFRDPKGYVLHHNKNVYRVINTSYQEEYDYCIKSGLYKKLIDEGLLLSFEESLDLEINSKDVYKIVKQEGINFISYPYEWSFDMIKDAAITTLKIQEISMEHMECHLKMQVHIIFSFIKENQFSLTSHRLKCLKKNHGLHIDNSVNIF